MRIPALALAAVATALLVSALSTAPSASAAGWTAPPWTLAPAAPLTVPYQVKTVVDPAGNTTVAWASTTFGWMTLWSRSRPAGGPWDEPLVVAEASGYLDFDIGADRAGNLTVAWASDTGLAAARLAPGGDAWQPDHVDAAASSLIFGPDLAVAPDGGRTLAWIEDDGSTMTIRAATGSATGWDASATVTASDAAAFETLVATAGDGGARTLVWSASDSSSGMDWVDAARLEAGGWNVVRVAEPGDRGTLKAAGDGRRAVATWLDNGDWGDPARLVAAYYEDGAWSLHDLSTDISDSPCDSFYDVTMAPGGDATAVWQAPSAGNSLVASEGRPTGWSAPRVVWRPLVGESLFDFTLAPRQAATLLTIGVWDADSERVTVRATRRTGPSWTDLGAGATLPALTYLSALAAGGDTRGNAAVGWAEIDPEGRGRVRALGIQATPPALRDLAVPDSGAVDAELAFSVAPRSELARIGRPSWNFGDGSPIAHGELVRHAYSAPGRYTVTVTVADSAGNVSSASRPLRIGSGPAPQPRPRPALNPPFVRHRGGVLRLAPGAHALRVRLVNRNGARLVGAVRLGRFARANGRPAIRTLALRRKVRLPRRAQRTVALRLSKRALRGLRSSRRRSLPVRIILRMRAPDGRAVRSVQTFTLDGRAAFRRYARPGGTSPRKPAPGPVARKAC